MNQDLNSYFKELRSSLEADMPFEEVKGLVQNHPIGKAPIPKGKTFLNGTTMTITSLSVITGATLLWLATGSSTQPEAQNSSISAPSKVKVETHHTAETPTLEASEQPSETKFKNLKNSTLHQETKVTIEDVIALDSLPVPVAVPTPQKQEISSPLKKYATQKDTQPTGDTRVTWGTKTDDPPRPIMAQTNTPYSSSQLLPEPQSPQFSLREASNMDDPDPETENAKVFLIKATDTKEKLDEIQKALENEGFKANIKGTFRNGTLTALKGQVKKNKSNTSFVVTDFERVEITVKMNKKGELLGVDIASDDDIGYLRKIENQSYSQNQAPAPPPSAIPPPPVGFSPSTEEELRQHREAMENEAQVLAEEARAIAAELRATMEDASATAAKEAHVLRIEAQADALEAKADLLEESIEMMEAKKVMEEERIRLLEEEIELLRKEVKTLRAEKDEAKDSATAEKIQVQIEAVERQIELRRNTREEMRSKATEQRNQMQEKRSVILEQTRAIRQQARELRKEACAAKCSDQH